eukprot:COSAG02_NODE_1763_length_11027_cov_4.235267_5_plen_92_part_00
MTLERRKASYKRLVHEMRAVAKAVQNVSTIAPIMHTVGDDACAGPGYACAGGKPRMQIGLQNAVCHAMLMVCSRAYVPGLAKGCNTGLNQW